MRRNSNGLLAVALVILGLPAAAWAKDVSRFQFRGQNAFAYFGSSEGRCIFIDAYVELGSIRLQTNPKTAQDVQAVVSVSKYNICTETQLMYAFGAATLSQGNFQIRDSLRSARLNTAVELFDYISETTFSVDVALTWTATGEVTRGNEHSHIRSPYEMINSRSIGVFRDAAAAGTISDGTTNFTPDPSSYAEISSVKSGFLEVIQ